MNKAKINKQTYTPTHTNKKQKRFLIASIFYRYITHGTTIWKCQNKGKAGPWHIACFTEHVIGINSVFEMCEIYLLNPKIYICPSTQCQIASLDLRISLFTLFFWVIPMTRKFLSVMKADLLSAKMIDRQFAHSKRLHIVCEPIPIVYMYHLLT